jgi:hypothetical protein
MSAETPSRPHPVQDPEAPLPSDPDEALFAQLSRAAWKRRQALEGSAAWGELLDGAQEWPESEQRWLVATPPVRRLAADAPSALRRWEGEGYALVAETHPGGVRLRLEGPSRLRLEAEPEVWLEPGRWTDVGPLSAPPRLLDTWNVQVELHETEAAR